MDQNNSVFGHFSRSVIQNEAFLTFCPLALKVKIRLKKTRSQAILKIMKIEAESLYTKQQCTNFLKLRYSLKSSVKPFKQYYCHKLILNNINKMGIFQRCIQNPFKHVRWHISQK